MTYRNDNQKHERKRQAKNQKQSSSIENDPTPENNPFYGERSHKNS